MHHRVLCQDGDLAPAAEATASPSPGDGLALARAAASFADDALPPERIVWLVASALVDEGQREQHVSALCSLAARTGVRVPRWERAVLASATWT